MAKRKRKGRYNVPDNSPIAVRAVSNIELTRLGFRRASLTKREEAMVKEISARMTRDNC